MAWVRGRAEAIARLAGKPVFVKETGVPNSGGTPHSRSGSGRSGPNGSPGAADADERARLVRFFGRRVRGLRRAMESRKLESPIEAHWGLMTAERQPYPAFGAWAETAARR